jgi:hypothetical protein
LLFRKRLIEVKALDIDTRQQFDDIVVNADKVAVKSLSN